MKHNSFSKCVVSAFAAILFGCAAFAGDIFEIRPLAGSCEPSSALKSGQKLQFLVRLAARDYTNPSPKPWEPVYVGLGSEELGKINMPRFGIVVSGRLKFADIVSFGTNVEKGAHYTDIVCEYKVEPGDFALPVRLALQGSTETAPKIPLVDDIDASSGYFVGNVEGIDLKSPLWRICNADGDICDFTFCDNATRNSLRSSPGWPNGNPIQDIDLSMASFYIKSIDFDSNADSEDYWRIVQEGKTRTTYKPTIQTIGVSSTNEAPSTSIKLYVWSEDESAVVMTGPGVSSVEMDVPAAGGTTVKATRQVYSFDLVTGEKEYPITFKGVQRGKSANIVLSATPGYMFNFAKTSLITNYLVRTVYCKEPDKPSVTISFDGSGMEDFKTVVASTNDMKDVYMKDAVPLYVTIDEAFNEEVTLTVKAEITGEPGVDVFEKSYVAVDREQRRFSALPYAVTNITFSSTETVKSFFAYPMGGDDATAEKGVKFTIEWSSTVSDSVKGRYDCDSFCTLLINDTAPAIVGPAATTLLTGSVKEGCTIPVEISDCYRDLNPPQVYTVEVTFSDGAIFTTNNVSFRRGKPTNIVAMGFGQKASWARIKVTDAQGNYGISENIPMTVPAAKTVAAELVLTQSQTDPAVSVLTFPEGESRFLRFRLGPDDTATSLTEMYAFLVPLNYASSNLVTSFAFKEGVLIEPDSQVSSVPSLAKLTFLDGSAESENLQYDIVLRTGNTPTSPEVTTYTPKRLYLSVTNIVPVTKNVYVDGSADPIKPGEHFSTGVAAGKKVDFVAQVSDASYCDVTNGLMAVWCFTEGRNSSNYKYSIVTSTTDTVSCKHEFVSPGVNQSVRVIVVDKDMMKALLGDGVVITENKLKDIWPSLRNIRDPYEFTVFVAEELHVIINPEELVFTEGETTGKLRIELSAPAAAKTTIDIEMASLNELGNPGVLELEATKLTIEEGATEPKRSTTYNNGLKFKYKEADGTAGSTDDGWYVKASATDALDTNYAYGESYVYVLNAPPVIAPKQPEVTTTNSSVSLKQAFDITWKVSDVAADLTKGITCTWSIDDVVQGDKTVTVKDDKERTTSLTLTSEGLHKITLTATDKDGDDYNGTSTRYWYYYITPTKRLEVNVFGPAGTTKTKYTTASGIGQGRVWADGISSVVEGFIQTWSYSVKAPEAEVHAYGYASSAAPYADNGSLGSPAGRDVALDADGNGWETGKDYFEYDGKFDNFFYRWAYISAGSSASASGVAYGEISPTVKSLSDTRETVMLTPYDKDAEAYAKTVLEAVFSREYLESDNMGDINRDYIPDLYIQKFRILGESTVSADDLASQLKYNDDADYLPGTATSDYSSFIPGLPENWSSEWMPFTMKLELRGYGDALNDAAAERFPDGVANPNYIKGAKPDKVYTDPKVDEKSTLTLAEYRAFVESGGDPADPSTYDSWSPERPSNPTIADTDEDGYPDGYEYYFWYRAHVGWIDGRGVHTYLTGERYDPVNPGEPITILPAEIKAVFDPIVATDAEAAETRDTDNDGIPDLVEFYLGTNPIHWDTDRDGLPDGYEIMIGGNENAEPTDPLVASTVAGLLDGMRNYDGDYMAYQTNIAMSVFATSNGWHAARTGSVGDNCFALASTLTEPEFHADKFQAYVLTLANGRKYMTTKVLDANCYYEVSAGVYALKFDLEKENCWRYSEYTGEDETKTVIEGIHEMVMRGTLLNAKELPDGTAVDCDRLVMYYREYDEATDSYSPGSPWGVNGPETRRIYNVWKYGIRSAAVNGGIYGGWALGGDAFITNGVQVFSAPAGETVYRLHHYAYQSSGFDPRTAWCGPGVIGDSVVGNTNLNGNATNLLKSVDTRGYNDYDEFLVMTFFAQSGRSVLNRNQFSIDGSGAAISPIDITPIVNSSDMNLTTFWGRYCTNPNDPDTDLDGIPDGWELYIMSGPRKGSTFKYPGPISEFSPLLSYRMIEDADPDKDGLSEADEFSSTFSAKVYESVSQTIVNRNPAWTNKMLPSDPWNPDTDDDGLSDGEEANHFVYGNAAKPGAGGGLNPLSWDTDEDGLPDPWEVQYAGSYTAGATTTSERTEVSADGATTNKVTIVARGDGSWSGGMDGSVKDALLDYDFDGLLNFQEYLVNAMRCFRYDDPVSGWQNEYFDEEELALVIAEIKAGDNTGWNNFWYHRLIDEQNEFGLYNPHLVNGTHDNGAGWFSLCTNEWDRAVGGYYMFPDGVYHDLSRPPDKYKEGDCIYNRFTWKYKESGMASNGPFYYGDGPEYLIYPRAYPGTDPRNHDSDYDGMDDYYELFHGLNPLLGHAEGVGRPANPSVDLIHIAYGGSSAEVPIISAINNYWFNLLMPHETVGAPNVKNNEYDFFQYPWLAGLPEADPDGDNLRNNIEAIMPKLQAASTYLHTDPTPLWMTDLSYAMSLPRRYYRPIEREGRMIMGVPDSFEYDVDGDGVIDPDSERWSFRDLQGFDYNDHASAIVVKGYSANPWKVDNYNFSFEQNEGYDTDGDYLSDHEEAQGKTKTSSDPQNADDPVRRQAMWFGGEEDPSFLQTPLVRGWSHPYSTDGVAPEQLFLYYTVECWAKPENPAKTGRQTLLERVIYTSAAHTADENYIRRNFLIGINNGRWYTKFDSTGTDALQAEEITDGPLATTNWTHIAATYDGTALRLYIDGSLAKMKSTGVQPEHGNVAAAISDYGELRPGTRSYDTISMLIGASAATFNGIVYDSYWRGLSTEHTTFADYDSYYRGYIDEVRVWDGARSDSEIKDSYRKRFSTADVSALRDRFYEKWFVGYTRRPTSEEETPAELRYHFNFDHVAGAVDSADLINVPAGFSTGWTMTDAKAIWSRPEGWVSPRWNSVKVASKIFSDRAWVPWIDNTVQHLPRYDLTTIDSVYWSENFAGSVKAADAGFKNFAFARSFEPYGNWIQMHYQSGSSIHTTPTRRDLVHEDADLYRAYVFSCRFNYTYGGDMLPMGGAYPRRISALEGGMWDEQGAADAWAQNGLDATNNGLPDWWEAYARANYAEWLAPGESLTWDTAVSYYGIPMTAWQAYLRDLAAGMLPDLEVHAEYADSTDNDGDGLPDWWETYWSLKNSSGLDDPDHDGLSNQQEYRLSENEAEGFGYSNGYPMLNPTSMRTEESQAYPDYFKRLAAGDKSGRYVGWYLGEIVADHDFMEDELEAETGTDRTLYDAWSDNDHDGWSAFSELRYSTFKMGISARFASHIESEEEMKDFPIPVVHTTLRYNGSQEYSTNSVYVIEAYAGNNLQAAPSASYTVTPGSTVERVVNLGKWEDRVIHGTFTPGHIVAGQDKIFLQYLFVQPNELYTWSVASNMFSGTYSEMYAAYIANRSDFKLGSQPSQWNDALRAGGIDYIGDDVTGALQVSVEDGQGYLVMVGERVGKVDIVTGDFDFDMSKVGKYFMGDSGVSLKQGFLRIRYSTKIPALQISELSVSLASADRGSLSEGVTAFTAYLDLDGDGFTPGRDPLGIAKDVQVGWDKVPAFTIELTDSSPAAGKRFVYDDTVENLKIIRTEINGSETFLNGEKVKRRIVYSRNAADFAGNIVHEGNFVTSGKFGLDWNALRGDVRSAGIALKDVASVKYLVVKNTVNVDRVDPTNIIDEITVSFPALQTKPKAVSPAVSSMGIVETQRPTFRWTGTSDNTAFMLRIMDAFGSVVYSNDMQVLPARDTTGAYAWTAPVYIGTNVCNDVWSLDNGAKYTWQVAMFNAKYSTAADAIWSDPASFTTALADSNNLLTGYGTANVSVKYYGPAANRLSDVIVELYRTADFTGQAAARTRLFDIDGTVGDLGLKDCKVSFKGLESGDYYAVAFIDRNGNMKRDKWESWGYMNQIGSGFANIYTPVSLVVDAANTSVSTGMLYMEDTDVNQDDIPDCLTMDESILSAASESAASGTDTTDVDGDGLTGDDETGDSYTDAQKWDTDGDSMPDGWEYKFANLDPLYPDAEVFIAGDMMAFATESAKRVTDASGAEYLLMTTNEVSYRVGDIVPNNVLVTCYDYRTVVGEGTNISVVTYCGVGTNLTSTASTFKIDIIEDVTVAYVHAQVYDRYGYNPKTAVDVEGAVNTKPFTALDKYMVVRYLQAIGLADEEAMNAGRTWEASTLRPLDIDNDRDGIADGWELYVMSGPAGAGRQIAHSPWVFNDREYDADGDKLSQLYEYDGGAAPTDPWLLDSDGDGIGDGDAYRYMLKGEGGLRRDSDNDGLSNFMEFMISSLDGFMDLDPARMSTFAPAFGGTQLVPDYFIRHGKLYLGEMFTDHDFIEDWYEDKQPVEIDSGSTRKPNVSRFRYDASGDVDGDGWSNWAEARAEISSPVVVLEEVVTNKTQIVTNIVETTEFALGGFRPVPELSISLSYNGDRASIEDQPVVVRAWTAGRSHILEEDAKWANGIFFSADAELKLGKPDNGSLREGKCLFEVFADINGDGLFQPSEPYGVVNDVNVGYRGVEPFAVELTDINPSIVRIAMDSSIFLQDSMKGTLYEDLQAYPQNQEQIRILYSKINSSYTDRGVYAKPWAMTSYPMYVGTNTTFASSNSVLVRVVRSFINGKNSPKYSEDVVLEREFSLSTNSVITEAEVLESGMLDLDWEVLCDAWVKAGNNIVNLTNVSYRIVFNDPNVSEKTENNNLALGFVNAFEYGISQTPAAPVQVMASGSQPTFYWKHENSIGKAYPAFRLRIWEPDGKTLVYDSGSLRAPTRSLAGVYSWTAPVYDGMLTSEGKVFSTESNYVWGVSMLDAKFFSPNDQLLGKDTKQAFRLGGSSAAGGLADYGLIPVAVKYMGPGKVVTDSVAGLIRVEAYTSDDFSGRPFGVSYVRHVDTLAAADKVELNALVTGLPLGRKYYILAYLDTNGNGKRDEWESWGYGNYVGTDRKDVYTPRVYELASKEVNDGTVPECVVYLEDADTNDNKIPDVWEWNKDGKLGGESVSSGAAVASPYIVTIPDGSSYQTVNLFVSLDSSAIGLPYYSTLVQMSNGGTLSAASLALALAGIDLGDIDLKPAVTITSFSLTDGITIKVDPKATINGKTFKPAAVGVSVTLSLRLEFASSLIGTWTEVASVSKTFGLSSDVTEIPAADLADMNAAIKAGIATSGTAGFYRVVVEIPSAVIP